MTEQSFLTSDKVRLALHRRGQGRCNFVFQHGLCGTAAQPSEVTSDRDDVQLITLECRGHGGSEAGDPERYSIAQFSDDVVAMIETLDHPVVLGGISMGAAIAMRIAVKRPDLVRALVLARPAWVTASAPENMKANALVGELLSKFDAEEARTRFLETDLARYLEKNAPDNVQSLIGFFSRYPLDVTSALLRRISTDGPGLDDAALSAISMPTLVIGHDDDVIHPLAYANELARRIAHSKLAIITSKVSSKDRYVSDFRHVLSQFLNQVCDA